MISNKNLSTARDPRNGIIPTLGYEGTHWGPVELICPSIHIFVRPSVSLSGRLHRFLEIICAARKCVQRIQPQATGSNLLSGSIICLSVRSYVGFLRFFFCIHLQCGGPSSRFIYPHTGFLRNPVGSSWSYISVRPSVCISVSLSVLPPHFLEII